MQGINYKDIVPWGRSLGEYLKMFSLTPQDLKARILDCGGGPSGFNAQLTQQGARVTSVDPVYALSAADMRKRIAQVFDDVIAQTRAHAHKFIWKNIPSVEELSRIRMAAMNTFLDDFEKGKQQGRYICAGLPCLPFEDKSFDMSLSSHFLFLYSANLSLDDHRKAIGEMIRVSKEIRIFPLIDLNTKPSPHVAPLVEELTAQGHAARIEPVDYEFQKGGNRMLRIICAQH